MCKRMTMRMILRHEDEDDDDVDADDDDHISITSFTSVPCPSDFLAYRQVVKAHQRGNNLHRQGQAWQFAALQHQGQEPLLLFSIIKATGSHSQHEGCWASLLFICMHAIDANGRGSFDLHTVGLRQSAIFHQGHGQGPCLSVLRMRVDRCRGRDAASPVVQLCIRNTS